jgi:hypothetical protein
MSYLLHSKYAHSYEHTERSAYLDQGVLHNYQPRAERKTGGPRQRYVPLPVVLRSQLNTSGWAGYNVAR